MELSWKKQNAFCANLTFFLAHRTKFKWLWHILGMSRSLLRKFLFWHFEHQTKGFCQNFFFDILNTESTLYWHPEVWRDSDPQAASSDPIPSCWFWWKFDNWFNFQNGTLSLHIFCVVFSHWSKFQVCSSEQQPFFQPTYNTLILTILGSLDSPVFWLSNGTGNFSLRDTEPDK